MYIRLRPKEQQFSLKIFGISDIGKTFHKIKQPTAKNRRFNNA